MNPIAKIYLDRLAHNFDYINSHIKNSNILAVVKANAYGHGAIRISKSLHEMGVKGLCVATANELIELREAKITTPIIHLGVLSKQMLDLYQSKNNMCTINSIGDINMINDLLVKSDRKINCYLKVDTGMGRLGIPYCDFENVINLIKDSNKINLIGIYSHFSSSDEESGKESFRQLEKFNQIINISNNAMSANQQYHISNSAGILNSDLAFYDAVRVGISLYGINITNIKHDLKPVMELKAPIVFTKEIDKGDCVGYNKRFVANQKTKVGYLQVGYADGYPLEMMDSKYVLYNQHLLKVIGKVSMDITAVDFTDVSVSVGDWVTLFGGDCNRLEEVCPKTKTNPYSILTNIGNRVIREYANG